MIASVLTAFLWALSGIFARRSSLFLGSQRANLARQMLALFLLGLWAHSLGQGLHGQSLGILFLSGVVGFGLGDWALFEAFPRIGSALTMLLSQCLAAPIAAIIEWFWLGTAMTFFQMLSSAIILAGVALAIAPAHKSDIPAGHRITGITFGILAAFGQASGAVMSRYAFHLAGSAGFALDGITAAYQRLWGGVLCVGLLLLIRQLFRAWKGSGPELHRPDWKQGWPWMVANALTGATLGVSCYQWALKSTPSAIVLPIVATTPLIVILIAFAFEGVRPSLRTIIGALLAVTGVVTLILL
jgi:drug/metabolite transporter (DMT)-like permease